MCPLDGTESKTELLVQGSLDVLKPGARAVWLLVCAFTYTIDNFFSALACGAVRVCAASACA